MRTKSVRRLCPPLHGQGAIEWRPCATAGTLKAQGATEYLVLLAVVLVIALVSIALLSYFPGMMGDETAKQSEAYWKSASPISIVEWSASYYSSPMMGAMETGTLPKLVIRNNGVGTITITKLFIGEKSIENVWSSPLTSPNMSTVYSIGPGQETSFGTFNPGTGAFTLGPEGAVSSATYLAGASSVCAETPAGEYLEIKDFAFEYDVYVEGAKITKRQFGAKPILIKCS